MANGSSDGAAPLGPGAFVGVVGPSGAGKDSVIGRARALLCDDASFVFPQRIVTRPPDKTESNFALSEADFAQRDVGGEFALRWAAHGLSYAVPISADEAVINGRVVVVNVSRAIVPALRRRYGRGFVVLIDAPASLRRDRLAQRGREDTQAIERRIARDVGSFQPADADVVINNGGELEAAAHFLAEFLEGLSLTPARTGLA